MFPHQTNLTDDGDDGRNIEVHDSCHEKGTADGIGPVLDKNRGRQEEIKVF